MVLISWFKEIKSKGLFDIAGVMPGLLNHIKSWLLDLLASSDPAFPTKGPLLPYTELSKTYSKMRDQASQLLHTVESSGMFESFLSTNKIHLESLSVDDAINFASKLPMLSNDNVANDSLERHLVDGIESAKQQLLTTSGYLKCVQVRLRCKQ